SLRRITHLGLMGTQRPSLIGTVGHRKNNKVPLGIDIDALQDLVVELVKKLPVLRIDHLNEPARCFAPFSELQRYRSLERESRFRACNNRVWTADESNNAGHAHEGANQ